MEAAFDHYEITTSEEYSTEDKLHRLINLLPIPILDGGHLLFFLVQAITRKPLNENIVKYATSFGMLFLIGIMFLVFYNDISYYWQDIKTFIVR